MGTHRAGHGRTRYATTRGGRGRRTHPPVGRRDRRRRRPGATVPYLSLLGELPGHEPTDDATKHRGNAFLRRTTKMSFSVTNRVYLPDEVVQKEGFTDNRIYVSDDQFGDKRLEE